MKFTRKIECRCTTLFYRRSVNLWLNKHPLFLRCTCYSSTRTLNRFASFEMAGESVVNSLREKYREPWGIISMPYISSTIALLVRAVGHEQADWVYFSKGFTSNDRIRWHAWPSSIQPNIGDSMFTPRVFMGHDPPTRVRFRNSEHPRSE